MRVLVCGGRDFNNWTFLETKLNDFRKTHTIDVIIHGCSRGADSSAANYANIHKIPQARFPAKWNRLGRSAGYVRNQEMLDDGKPDIVLAFPTGGPGTKDMIARARKANINVLTFLQKEGQ